MSAQNDEQVPTRHPRPCACMGHWRPDRRGLLAGVAATSSCGDDEPRWVSRASVLVAPRRLRKARAKVEKS